MALEGVDNTEYDEIKNNDGTMQFVSGSAQMIGSRFRMLYVQKDEKTVSFTLTIDGECSLNIEMIGQHYYSHALQRYQMNYVRVDVPECYRCFTCGLFGDFQGFDMQTCDGQGTVDYGGWKNAWDERAWTRERTYVEVNCPPIKIPSD